MKNHLKFTLLIITSTLLYCTLARSEAQVPASISTPQPKSTSLLDRYNKIVHEAFGAVNKKLDAHEPRKIAKGALPAIVLRKDKIFYNDAQLFLGTKLQEWLEALPTGPRCIQFSQVLKSCHWDDLGLTLSVNGVSSKVERLDIQFQKRVISEAAEIVAKEDSVQGKQLPLTSEPVGTFRGYFELDGYGIDSNTMFWEIESAIDQSRNLHCGLRDCQFRGAIFGENSRIYIRLNGPSATSTVSLIQIDLE